MTAQATEADLALLKAARQPTQKQIDAAHDAWDQTVQRWKLSRVSSFGLGADTWLVENVGGPAYGQELSDQDQIAAHRFDGERAEQLARFTLRDKCIKAALTAALKAEEADNGPR